MAHKESTYPGCRQDAVVNSLVYKNQYLKFDVLFIR